MDENKDFKYYSYSGDNLQNILENNISSINEQNKNISSTLSNSSIVDEEILEAVQNNVLDNVFTIHADMEKSGKIKRQTESAQLNDLEEQLKNGLLTKRDLF